MISSDIRKYISILESCDAKKEQLNEWDMSGIKNIASNVVDRIGAQAGMAGAEGRDYHRRLATFISQKWRRFSAGGSVKPTVINVVNFLTKFGFDAPEIEEAFLKGANIKIPKQVFQQIPQPQQPQPQQDDSHHDVNDDENITDQIPNSPVEHESDLYKQNHFMDKNFRSVLISTNNDGSITFVRYSGSKKPEKMKLTMDEYKNIIQSKEIIPITKFDIAINNEVLSALGNQGFNKLQSQELLFKARQRLGSSDKSSPRDKAVEDLWRKAMAVAGEKTADTIKPKKHIRQDSHAEPPVETSAPQQSEPPPGTRSKQNNSLILDHDQLIMEIINVIKANNLSHNIIKEMEFLPKIGIFGEYLGEDMWLIHNSELFEYNGDYQKPPLGQQSQYQPEKPVPGSSMNHMLNQTPKNFDSINSGDILKQSIRNVELIFDVAATLAIRNGKVSADPRNGNTSQNSDENRYGIHKNQPDQNVTAAHTNKNVGDQSGTTTRRQIYNTARTYGADQRDIAIAAKKSDMIHSETDLENLLRDPVSVRSLAKIGAAALMTVKR